ncbi:Hypothetical predicted protein [Olea europaea subsp. europaea]|uniref:Uncharacterized protein n=1 Tax=Olea europaea subsp. europaea TaxID=158383 RepID=A0A8S0T037_OLEEU|nr:Hypothetical predicted protein [Olea europaea subsp. europaea]
MAKSKRQIEKNSTAEKLVSLSVLQQYFSNWTQDLLSLIQLREVSWLLALPTKSLNQKNVLLSLIPSNNHHVRDPDAVTYTISAPPSSCIDIETTAMKMEGSLVDGNEMAGINVASPNSSSGEFISNGIPKNCNESELCTMPWVTSAKAPQGSFLAREEYRK